MSDRLIFVERNIGVFRSQGRRVKKEFNEISLTQINIQFSQKISGLIRDAVVTAE
jgi:hypothetical protein